MTKTLMIASAVVLALAGVSLLFAPAELQRLTTTGDVAPVPPVVLQLWGAGLLALASADWIGSAVAIGGIYGRALVIANLVHWTVGGLSALRGALDRPSSALLWAAVAVYGLFAIGFAWLLRRDPLPR
jgi:uncharacterized protein YjeT (DUF2065 family)